MVRIKEERIDDFLQSVSRLFTTGELFKDVQARMGETGKIAPLVEELRQINNSFVVQSTALQRSVMELRRVSVAGLFSKFPQMARGLAAQLGKKIDVHLSGEDVEIDKSLVEDLDSPLTHMIRNVADHGIEPPADRRARGVAETGNLWLKAELTKTHVVITVRDDGRGIDPRVLRDKAVEKGIYSRAQADALSDADAIDLIFHAGFSTAKQISDVSGRGVGMDVVRTTLRGHNGDVLVNSQVGVGTTFRLEIPIRAAVLVIDGLLLRQNGEVFVLPFEYVREITELGADDLKPVQGSHVAVLRRGTFDAVSLGTILGLDGRVAAHAVRNGQRVTGVLVGCKHGEMCLLVDKILGHRQVVVNSIKELLPGVDRIAGVAQLGGGRLALVLSVDDLVDSAHKRGRRLLAAVPV
jgi:two-component system chemotaxis sensor kinase CheA